MILLRAVVWSIKPTWITRCHTWQKPEDTNQPLTTFILPVTIELGLPESPTYLTGVDQSFKKSFEVDSRTCWIRELPLLSRIPRNPDFWLSASDLISRTSALSPLLPLTPRFSLPSLDCCTNGKYLELLWILLWVSKIHYHPIIHVVQSRGADLNSMNHFS